MGKAERLGLYATHNVPGPGTYEPKGKRQGPKYHFGGRHSQSVSSLQPGPGQYTPSFKLCHKDTVYKYSMSGKGEGASGRSGSPGPGAYEVKVVKEKKGGRFGRDLRGALSLPRSMVVPGPGAYDRQKVLANYPASPRYTYCRTISFSLVLDSGLPADKYSEEEEYPAQERTIY